MEILDHGLVSFPELYASFNSFNKFFNFYNLIITISFLVIPI